MVESRQAPKRRQGLEREGHTAQVEEDILQLEYTVVHV